MGKEEQKRCFWLLCFSKIVRTKVPPSPARGFENVTHASGQAQNSHKMYIDTIQTIQFESLRKLRALRAMIRCLRRRKCQANGSVRGKFSDCNRWLFG